MPSPVRRAANWYQTAAASVKPPTVPRLCASTHQSLHWVAPRLSCIGEAIIRYVAIVAARHVRKSVVDDGHDHANLRFGKKIRVRGAVAARAGVAPETLAPIQIAARQNLEQVTSRREATAAAKTRCVPGVGQILGFLTRAAVVGQEERLVARIPCGSLSGGRGVVGNPPIPIHGALSLEQEVERRRPVVGPCGIRNRSEAVEVVEIVR